MVNIHNINIYYHIERYPKIIYQIATTTKINQLNKKNKQSSGSKQIPIKLISSKYENKIYEKLFFFVLALKIKFIKSNSIISPCIYWNTTAKCNAL